MSLRRDLVAKVKARFATIHTDAPNSHGYQTTIGKKLKVWHTTSLDAAQLDAVIIRDLTDTLQADPQGENSSRKTWKLRIVADAILAPGTDNEANAEKARKAIEDIKVAIAIDSRWDTLAKRTEEVSDQLMVAKDGTTVAGAQVIFDIVTSRSPFQP